MITFDIDWSMLGTSSQVLKKNNNHHKFVIILILKEFLIYTEVAILEAIFQTDLFQKIKVPSTYL